MEEKRILITGGLGNLGSWLTQHFISAGYKVTVLARKMRDVKIKGYYEIIFADISDYDALYDQLKGRYFDYVIHAASVNEGNADHYFRSAILVNVLGTRNLLEILKMSPPKNFIYLSTFHVYGRSAGYIDEDSLPNCRHDYATSHLQAEQSVIQFNQVHNMDFTILRLTNSYGCPKDLDSSKWYLILNDLARMAYENGEIVLKSNGNATRDFIWMGHVVEAVEQICQLERVPNGIFNLSSQRNYKMSEVAEYVQKAYQDYFGTSIPVALNEEDMNTYDQSLHVSSKKLRSLISIYSSPMFYQEATAIFKLLETVKKKELT
ncbi:SDR family oxidoreductase [Persicobacter psychrovividus]|uniref:UDP-glucose 4-epimerase n=1 Tax=Persicobacter psychrovividus TaxID=387638 RepID=A0ABM7VJE0_9BACT|nr:UDP-glucose 4-epimerase [Persicobacter psychrovividus]